MTWLLLNIPLAVLFFALWAGIPLWLVLKYPDTKPAPPAGYLHCGLPLSLTSSRIATSMEETMNSLVLARDPLTGWHHLLGRLPSYRELDAAVDALSKRVLENDALAGWWTGSDGPCRAFILPVSVRGGGHDRAGRAVRPGGLVIDLTAMGQVTVDTEAQTATVRGGATAGAVIAAAAPRGLVAAAATCGSVGLAGPTLAGGYGPLNGRFGLALDNLLGAGIVLADGRLVIADAIHQPDLFWAIRGGGGNFGVLTSLHVRRHRLRRLLAGFISMTTADPSTLPLSSALGTRPRPRWLP